LELLLKFIYDRHYNPKLLVELTDSDATIANCLNLIRLHDLAAKYDVFQLSQLVEEFLNQCVFDHSWAPSDWVKLIEFYYESARPVDGPLAKILQRGLPNEENFIKSKEYESLIISIPEFATDTVMASRRNGGMLYPRDDGWGNDGWNASGDTWG
jgi:hypothetical protein